jgi:hypothetical protein
MKQLQDKSGVSLSLSQYYLTTARARKEEIFMIKN